LRGISGAKKTENQIPTEKQKHDYLDKKIHGTAYGTEHKR
jgi:hypothetical protein